MLIAIGGFQPEDRVVLVVVWAILAFIWLSDIALVRLAASRRRADGELGSSH